jgi:hypothetical protein
MMMTVDDDDDDDDYVRICVIDRNKNPLFIRGQ